MPRFSNFSICITFLFASTLFWNFLNKTSFSKTTKWPEHWKAILKNSKKLQLILLDGSALKCFYYNKKDESNTAACNNLFSNLDARFGTKYDDFDKFWSLLYSNIIKPSKNQIILHAYTKPDTIVLKYNYSTNIEKLIFFTISTNKPDKHYHLLRGNSIVSTIAIPKIAIKSRAVNGYQIIVPENVKTYLPFFEAKKFVSCNKEVLNGTLEIHDFNTTIIPQEAVKKLFEFVEIFIDNGQIPFLAFGTLLGWYRECRIIPHTTDFDLHIYASEYDPLIEKVFNYYHPEFPLHHRIGKREYSLEYSFFLRHGIEGYPAPAVDIFYLYPHNETHEWSPFITSFSSFLRGKSFFPKVQGLCTADFYGYLFFVPCNFIEILKANYGRNWMNSDPNATYFDDGNSNIIDGQWNSNQNSSDDEIVHYFK